MFVQSEWILHVVDDRKSGVARVFTLVADAYDHAGIEFFSLFGEDLVTVAKLRTGERVLDVGCGRGAVTFPASRAVGERGFVEAIDIAPGMVAALQRDLDEREIRNVAVRLGDAESPDVPVGSLDAVLASLVLFFLPDVKAALRSYRTRLKPGGRLAFTTFGDSQPEWTAMEQRLATHLPDDHPAKSQPVGKPHTDPLASDEAIRATLTDAGFTQIEIQERVYPISYGTGERFVRFTQTTGLREIWDSLAPAPRAHAETELAAMADALRDASGNLTEPVRIRFTVATSP